MALGYTSAGDRNEILDMLRGAAVLGILWMNVVSFGLLDPAYFNLSAGGGDAVVDRSVGILGAIVFDQKMMGMFSALFGAGIVLFIERAARHRRHPVVLSLWRNVLLGAMGLVHLSYWDGDVLFLYAVCAPVVIALRRLAPSVLFGIAGALMVATSLWAVLVQRHLNASGGAGQLGWYWFDSDLAAAEALEWWVPGDGFARALGMMLIGVGLYRTGILTAERSTSWYRRAAVIGVGLGAALASIGVVWQASTGYSWRIAVVSSVPNTVGTAPMVVGYVAVGVLIHQRWRRIAAVLVPVGRMALTNYLAQTTLALWVLQGWWRRGQWDRSELVLFVVAVWSVQILWSSLWLRYFAQGPLEWLWRLGTYLRWTPLLRRNA